MAKLCLALFGLASASGQRLVIKNDCATEPLWIAHIAGSGSGPDAQNIKIASGASHAFTTPDNLQATRYWPKMRCNDAGNMCKLGGSGGPDQLCDTNVGCAPPVDTKFEATFGQGASCDPATQELTGCDYIDISMVDGWTLPFQFQAKGNCIAGGKAAPSVDLDCSKISASSCPSAEVIPGVGTVDLRLKHPTTGDAVGCYSPCSKLTLRSWNNTLAMSHTPQDAVAAPYCCPTPPESPDACRAGPVKSTKYVEAVHQSCPGVYGYSYDDGIGLMTCSPTTVYTLTLYCPLANATGSAAAEAVETVVI